MADTVHIWPDGRDVPLTFYPAPSAQGLAPAMLICPGGAYREHADHEGRGYAAWLNGHGIHCFVLAYRLGSHGHRYPAPFADVARATRVIRHHATRWGVDKNRVGILGSSAGGHLASMLLTRFGEAPTDSTDPIDRASCRPDLGILCYPVISMVKKPHRASKANLMGEAKNDALAKLLSSERHASAHVPPCFIWHTLGDQSVDIGHSLDFAQDLNDQGVPFELHTFERGRHGLGLNTDNPWPENCIAWLKVRQFICASKGFALASALPGAL